MKDRRGLRLSAAATAVSLFALAGCGEEGSVDTARESVVQVLARGAFADPRDGEMLATSAGTAFIIDSSGLAVTNNHVVTGAASLEVVFQGEPRHARVLGVSECSDLAVIKIEGDDFSAVQWAEDAANVNVDVWALGYPLGDPSISITKGIVSKISTDVNTAWASGARVLEHDARIRGGNSGGPLVAENGAVVGINYAGNSEHDINLAIDAQVAQPIVAQLAQGKNVESLGINGAVISGEDGTGLGLWVSSVESGSPASRVGIRAKDILLAIEGLPIGSDGTLKDYCDVLRSRAADATMTVMVYRYETSQFLSGEFNGRALAVVDDAQEVVDNGQDTDNTHTTQTEFVTIQDKSGRMSMMVPASWDEVVESEVDDGYALAATTDLHRFNKNDVANASGVVLAVYDDGSDFGTDAMRDVLRASFPESCDLVGLDTYDNGTYDGQRMMGVCPDGKADAIQFQFLLRPKDRAFYMYIIVNFADGFSGPLGTMMDSLLVKHL
ncbi:MAG: trypsin-like peptidase domain-containing protein [Deltaproteobacteria bacterium]|nr:trypsin-like peptidase domain-containing protein [Deltaproteobacteria bacterium]